jgi:hypothetical protein
VSTTGLAVAVRRAMLCRREINTVMLLRTCQVNCADSNNYFGDAASDSP